MSEYIELKAVINKINEIPSHFDSGDIKYGIEIAIQAIKDTLAADVVEVVRCKDCKYWDAVKNPKHKGVGICTPPRKDLGGYCVRRGATNSEGFCSYGERKDEE